MFPDSPLCAVNKIRKNPILMELTFEQMAQAEKMPANTVALIMKTSPRKRQIYLQLGCCFARKSIKVTQKGGFTIRAAVIR